jgi:hypothetical protein
MIYQSPRYACFQLFKKLFTKCNICLERTSFPYTVFSAFPGEFIVPLIQNTGGGPLPDPTSPWDSDIHNLVSSFDPSPHYVRQTGASRWALPAQWIGEERAVRADRSQAPRLRDEIWL